MTINRFAEGKPTSFAVNTGATVAIVLPDLVSYRQAQFNFYTVCTLAGSRVKVLGGADVRVCLCLLEFSHQIHVTDIVDEVLLSTDVMNV